MSVAGCGDDATAGGGDGPTDVARDTPDLAADLPVGDQNDLAGDAAGDGGGGDGVLDDGPDLVADLADDTSSSDPDDGADPDEDVTVPDQIGFDLPIGSQCRADSDCTPGLFVCLAPDEELPCGLIMMGTPCEDDDDCSVRGAGWVCDPPTAQDCVFGVERHCRYDCVESDDCDAGQVCGQDNRCQSQACGDGGDPCPAQFDCKPDDEPGECLRRGCSDDGDCAGGGFCVEGACYDELGQCSIVPV